MPVQRSQNATPTGRWSPRAHTWHPPQDGPRSDGTPRVAPGVYRLTRDASVQFRRPITVRVIRELTARSTYAGWAWVTCYVLDAKGDAVDRRELFVMPAGLQSVPDPAAYRARALRNAARPR